MRMTQLPELQEVYKHSQKHLRALPDKRQIEVVYEVIRNGTIRCKKKGQEGNLIEALHELTSSELMALATLVDYTPRFVKHSLKDTVNVPRTYQPKGDVYLAELTTLYLLKNPLQEK